MTQHTELIERLRAFSELSGFATAGWDLPASATSVLSKLCDGSHGAGVLAAAAASYAIAASRVLCGQHDNFVPPAIWPWHIDWWKPRDARSNLVRALALGLAEIERLDRAAKKEARPHVCGLQGFGALGDTCPGCEARNGTAKKEGGAA